MATRNETRCSLGVATQCWVDCLELPLSKSSARKTVCARTACPFFSFSQQMSTDRHSLYHFHDDAAKQSVHRCTTEKNDQGRAGSLVAILSSSESLQETVKYRGNTCSRAHLDAYLSRIVVLSSSWHWHYLSVGHPHGAQNRQ